jgi:hypothetical protein
MHSIHEDVNYLFYIGVHTDKRGFKYTIYNIVPKDKPAPKSGYKNRQWIENFREVKFPDRYQPTLRGMRETYSPNYKG